MAMVNVNRENSDPYYRYKMPRLMAKVHIVYLIDEMNLLLGWSSVVHVEAWERQPVGNC